MNWNEIKDILKQLPKQKIGEYSVYHMTVPETLMRLTLEPELTPGNEYTVLSFGKECLMSDSEHEMESNMEFVERAKGKVLIGGLGLGIIILAIQDKEEVTSIEVVEIADEVIELTKTLPFNEKVTIKKGDVFTYKPGEKKDTIYMDVWLSTLMKEYREMQQLEGYYSAFLEPDGYFNCWHKNDIEEALLEDDEEECYV